MCSCITPASWARALSYGKVKGIKQGLFRFDITKHSLSKYDNVVHQFLSKKETMAIVKNTGVKRVHIQYSTTCNVHVYSWEKNFFTSVCTK